MASSFLADIGRRYDGVTQIASELTNIYQEIPRALGRLSDKKMEVAEKVKLLAETGEKEANAIKIVAALATSLRSGTRR